MSQKLNKNQKLEIIQQVSQEISSSTWIPGYDKEDIYQEAIIIGINNLNSKNYQPKIPYKNYIANHIRHRLRSLRRKVYIRPTCDCGKCLSCKNNKDKQKISCPENLDDITDDSSLLYTLQDEVIQKELIEKIDKSIPAEYREDYLKLLAGVYVVYSRKIKIREIIQKVLDEQ